MTTKKSAGPPPTSQYGQDGLSTEKNKRVKWGMDSGTEMRGLAMMGIAVLWFGLGWAAGFVFWYPPIPFFIGLFAFLKGTIGEAGIW